MAGLSNKYIEQLLKYMEFNLKNGSKSIWEKEYVNHNGYYIQVDFDNKKIIYETNKDNCVKVCNENTTNFSKEENFVVLECVNRLLVRGYKPNTIELEHDWPSGHGTSGRLDIMVKKDNQSYLMIECKTYGKEFEKEKQKMITPNKNGESKGQLLSYYWEENKTTQYLCLYASAIIEETLKIQQGIIPVDESWKALSNKKEVFAYWNKSFKKNGIFEDYITPYNIECKSLLRGDLDKITDESSKVIFNQFLEILRHNVVSDKPNAFNKILNLFICKIIDEDKNDDEELQFQWKDDSTYVSLQSSLEELYKQGMDRFLDIEVTDYSDADIERSMVSLDRETKALIKKMFQELRLQKNPEFAFKEVYNEESFYENAIVLKEVVELLQPYQFRYGHKQQFLGDFFEKLLNTSIKQEAGQFFTPVPIARFMITSLPIKEMIDIKVEGKSKDLLPSMVDYACGAGHFLTEYMDVVQGIINNYDTNGLRPQVRNKIEKWKQTDNESEVQGEFEWASDYVYGIEKDYRLVKTTKISTFLNGDGQANVIHADGLDRFSSEKYKGLLSAEGNKNCSFDLVVTNPPYSVSAFKQTLAVNHNDFETYQYLTESSSEIECLFVERTEQLLKEGGCAAIILPISILSNTLNIYSKTREILLKNFNIKAIAKMGPNTFMATGINTIIVFLEKRSDTDKIVIKKLVTDFFETYKDFSYGNVKEIIDGYIKNAFDNISYEEYIDYIKGEKTSSKIEESSYYKNCKKFFLKSKELKELKKKKDFKKLDKSQKDEKIEELFKKYIVDVEHEKIEYYLFMVLENTLLINAGEKQDEKEFLGYEKRNEQLIYYKDENGCISSKLYDENIDSNPEKVNYYIRKMYNKEICEIPEILERNIRYIPSYDLLTYNEFPFSNAISLSKKPKPYYNCDSDRLAEYVNIKIGGTPPRNKHSYFTGENLWVSIGEMDGQIIEDTNEKITDEAIQESNVKLIKKGTTLLSFKLSIGKVAIAGKDLYTNEAIAALEIKEKYKDDILDEYLFYLFKSKVVDIAGDTKAFGIVLNSGTLGDVIIPKPSIDEQREFIKRYKAKDEELEQIREKRSVIEQKRIEHIQELKHKGYPAVQLGDEDFLNLKRGPFGGDLKKEIFVSSGYKVYEQKHVIMNDFSVGRYYITKEKFEEMLKFEVKPYDILMSCSSSKKETIGKTVIVPGDAEPGIINQALLRIRATDKILPMYLKICLEEIAGNLKSYGMGIENLSSVESLRNISIFVPETIDEQKKIISEMKVYDDEMVSLEECMYKVQAEQRKIIFDYI